MSAEMQQHKAQVRKTMRQAASENTFALEELADELKDAKHCLTRATRPHIKSLLASQIRYAAAEELNNLFIGCGTVLCKWYSGYSGWQWQGHSVYSG